MARWNEPMSKEAFGVPTGESIGKAISGMPGAGTYTPPPPSPTATGMGTTLAQKLLGGAGKAGTSLAGAGKALAKRLWEADLGVPTSEGVTRQISGM